MAAHAMGNGRHPIHHDGAFSVLSTFMPLLLPELGVETASAVDLWAGILNGVTSFVAAFASPVWGRVADRRGRKLMLLRSSIAIGFFTALMGVAVNVWQFFPFRALMGVFAGFSSAAIALVASQVPEGRDQPEVRARPTRPRGAIRGARYRARGQI
jgi:MFS transporter, DHA1 family, multidrug resistance protein